MNKIKYTTALLLGGILSFSSCTDNFSKFNDTKGAYTDELQKYDNQTNLVPFATIQKGVIYQTGVDGTDWQYQIIQNLVADMYCGYFHDMNGAFNKNNSTYNLNNGWTSAMWIYSYGNVMPSIADSEQLNTEKDWPLYHAITKILKVAVLHRVSDYYGSILYDGFGTADQAPQSQKEVYKRFFEDLGTAINILKDYKGGVSFESADFMMPEGKRTPAQWLKFANSLRLRLAIRVSNVDRGLAEEQAKAALDVTNGGVLETANETVGEYGIRNPLGGVAGWGEVFMNASLESFLKGYNDPRLKSYFNTAQDGRDKDGKIIKEVAGVKQINSIEGEFKGVRQGTGVGDNRYSTHSATTITVGSKIVVMSAAEVWFLRAEAALRGYTSEDVETCYKQGVTISFAQWDANGVSEYLESENTPADYIDAFNKDFDAKATTTITPKWDNGASIENKLERIITQKWLALYPEGCEAWAEQRRTGYPKLFKVAVNNSGNAISTDDMIRRVFFNQDYKTDNPKLYNALVDKLNGADTGATRLWWDAGKNNF
ncbi:SusD/RagB family nutrient-binding outer membrane lipoprotein [uncultured Bacteroides sp.]|uniref:SusD/RagB family nutrient-binding outer membrane lipoprotein n=1 Tax=uncultured Bacteroides sp. TaxID=162156 RepID=UPI0025DD94B5|nr:SusD/RagB family nutrient-binding outer membrane lipoprotein [uncultured Bacteroides sp.]